MTLLEVKNLKNIYTARFGASQVQALSDVSFSVEKGEYVAIMGESGSARMMCLVVAGMGPWRETRSACSSSSSRGA